MPDNASIKNLYTSLRDPVIRLVSKIVPPKEIEDIVQETYVRICQIDERENIAHPRSYLMKTARNLALDYLKRAETRLSDTIEDDSTLSVPGALENADQTFDQVAARERFGIFCEAVRLLPQQCRRAFVLKKVYGYTQKEIAESMGISQATVEKHIASGVRRCADFIADNERGENYSTDKKRAFGSF